MFMLFAYFFIQWARRTPPPHKHFMEVILWVACISSDFFLSDLVIGYVFQGGHDCGAIMFQLFGCLF